MLGENIAALRKKAGMTQQSLADALYVTRQTISKWEKNLSVPTRTSLSAWPTPWTPLCRLCWVRQRKRPPRPRM